MCAGCIIVHYLFSSPIPSSHSLTVCAVVQAPAVAQAISISLVIQCHSVGVCDYQTWARFTTQFHGLLVWNSYLFLEGSTQLIYQIAYLVIDLFFVVLLYSNHAVYVEAACHYLQPVIETKWALLSFNVLNVEIVREVKRHSEAKFYRNDVLTGHGLKPGVGISWAEQLSLWLIKYTTIAGYWAIGKIKTSLRFIPK